MRPPTVELATALLAAELDLSCTAALENDVPYQSVLEQLNKQTQGVVQLIAEAKAVENGSGVKVGQA